MRIRGQVLRLDYREYSNRFLLWLILIFDLLFNVVFRMGRVLIFDRVLYYLCTIAIMRMIMATATAALVQMIH